MLQLPPDEFGDHSPQDFVSTLKLEVVQGLEAQV